MLRDHKAIAYALMRLALGINIFGHGFFRILSGVGAFANGAVNGMDKGPLPHALSLAFLYATPFIELILGILLTLGLFTRLALIGGSLFMIALTFGTTSTQNWNGAGTQLQYSLVFFVMLWLVEANSLSVDGMMGRKNV
ncbi:putative membrane protein [Terriglobus roseus DSM 18391]|uniref:Putative membrane protein n=1 Tax=Terriglobus roseus (strain DSM 18391 / NRRL B-41598 / KBS 63) TaxID=926566 RepID=I3ZG65_TERRK|nr:DoxX family membrane protein [Terriglobus roseus]AFL88233.1 putative membrane protein [Terriglobus roseus DSM 18391]